MGGKAVTSRNACPPDNFRAYSPQTSNNDRPQPDIPLQRLRDEWPVCPARLAAVTIRWLLGGGGPGPSCLLCAWGGAVLQLGNCSKRP